MKFSTTLVSLAMLTSTAMGGIIQNIHSSHFYADTFKLSDSRRTEWSLSCSAGRCYFSKNGQYTYDGGAGYVTSRSGSGTRWTLVKLPSGYYQVKSPAGKCWAQYPALQIGARAYLRTCNNKDTDQWWYIPGVN